MTQPTEITQFIFGQPLRSWQGNPAVTTSAVGRPTSVETSPRFGTWGNRSANTAEACESLSAKAIVEKPAASRPSSKPATPANNPTTVFLSNLSPEGDLA